MDAGSGGYTAAMNSSPRRTARLSRFLKHPATIAAIVSAAVAVTPALASTMVNVARNALAVDGQSAVKYTTNASSRKRSLVATNRAGLLPNNIIATAPNADKVDGLHASAFLRTTDASQFVPVTDKVGVRVYDTSGIDQTIPDNTATAVTFDTEAVDNHNVHSSVLHPSRLTAPISGMYVITGYVHWGGTTVGSRSARIRLNGTTTLTQATATQVAAEEQHQSIATVVYLSALDYVELVVEQDAGHGGTPIVVGSTSDTNFGMVMTSSLT